MAALLGKTWDAKPILGPLSLIFADRQKQVLRLDPTKESATRTTSVSPAADIRVQRLAMKTGYRYFLTLEEAGILRTVDRNACDSSPQHWITTSKQNWVR